MIWLQQPPGGVFHTTEEFEEYKKSLQSLKVKSYEEYLEKGHEWCWCLVGNIVEEHEYGEDKEIKPGTKHFVGSAKVCLAPAQWGDGYEKIVVIGVARKSRKYIEVVMQKKYIENFRMQKIYKPMIVRKMINSEYSWWSDSNDDRLKIIQYLETLAPEEAEKEKQTISDMKWMETRNNNGLVEPLIREELAKRYDQTEKDGKTYFRRQSGELFHPVRVQLVKGDADFFVIEYMDSLEDGDSFYPEDYGSLEAMMEAIFREIDQE